MSVQDHRYKAGLASLAIEVLKQAKRCGESNESLRRSIWTQYLVYYSKIHGIKEVKA